MGANFLQDHNGNNSSLRLGTLLWLLGVLGAWIFVAVTTKALPDIPTNVATVIGLILTAKVAQTGVELNPPKPKDIAP